MESTAAVLWWRAWPPQPDRIPPGALVGWSDPTGSRHGQTWITDPTRRLATTTVTDQLHRAILDQVGPAQLLPAAAVPDLSPAVRLLTAGHRVHDTDLHSLYGLGVVGGVTAVHDAGGPAAHVVLERTLHPAVRQAVAAWAAQAIDQLATSPERDLPGLGWQRTRRRRWQLLATQ